MAELIFGLILNIIIMCLSIYLVNTLHKNKLIDKSNRNTLVLFSVFFPLGALIIVVLKTSRTITHLVKMNTLLKG